MKNKNLLLQAFLFFIGVQFLVAQNKRPYAENDTLWSIPGYPMSINVLLNDFDLDGDSVFIAQSQIAFEDSILYFDNDYNTFYAVKDTVIKKYYISDDPENWFNSYDTGYIYIILDNPYFEYLDVNNISAQFNNFGNHFWEMPGGNGAQYFVPKNNGKIPLFANTLWIGGLDESNQLHLAAERYRQVGIDFWPGPISNIYDSVYDDKWNQVWKLNREEIEYHKSHWWESNYQPIKDIETWPGNGFIELGQSEQIAPYYDNNNDGVYSPFDGDWPVIKGDQALFFVFNDHRNIHTASEGLKLGIEIRGMAYAFNEPADSALWNTTFLHYEIVNRSDTTYYETMIGSFTDIDLGNPWDDYVGCDVQGGFYFGYNGDEDDENSILGEVIDYNYGLHPPAQAIMILGGPLMDEDGIDNPMYDENNQQICDMSINGLNFGDSIVDNERFGMTGFMYFNNGGNAAMCDPGVAPGYYNYMRNYWLDDSKCMYGSYGHILTDPEGPECNFMFPGDSDPCNWGTNGVLPNGGYNQNGLYWTEDQIESNPHDRRGLGSSGPFTFKPGDVQEVDLAFVWARDYEGDRLSSVELLKERCYYVKDKFEHEEDFFSGVRDEVATGNDISLYPNPVHDKLTINISRQIDDGNISIFNINGEKVIFTNLINTNEIIINTVNLRQSLYIVKLFDGLNNYTAKFIRK